MLTLPDIMEAIYFTASEAERKFYDAEPTKFINMVNRKYILYLANRKVGIFASETDVANARIKAWEVIKAKQN